MSFLEIDNLTKHFSGVHALKNVSFSVERGEIHAICGENGAGKSTLIKILSGIYPSGTYEGKIKLEGEAKHFQNIRAAEGAGIAVINQELALVKYMSIAENIFLGNEPNTAGIVDFNKMYSATSQLLNQLGLAIDAQTNVIELGIGEQQLVEIAKAINKKARILIMDEPTTALSEQEVGRLMTIIRELKSKGVTIIYISHKLNEIFALADRVTVMRDGHYIGTKKKDELSERELVNMMVGREIKDFYPKGKQQRGEAALSVRNLTLFDKEIKERKKVDDVTFDVYKGEILGIAGLMGSGRTELLNGIFGSWEGKKTGEIIVGNKAGHFNRPEDAISNGLALVPEDRKRFGLLLDSSIGINLNLASLEEVSFHGKLNKELETRRSNETVADVGIKCKSIEVEAKTLSGGNQQKVVLGKWLLTDPDILFLDEPTRGVDVGAKAEIYNLMNRFVEKGMAVVMVSSDLPEVIGMSDRILVLHEGKLAAEFPGRTTTQEEIMMAATGNLTPSLSKGEGAQ